MEHCVHHTLSLCITDRWCADRFWGRGSRCPSSEPIFGKTVRSEVGGSGGEVLWVRGWALCCWSVRWRYREGARSHIHAFSLPDRLVLDVTFSFLPYYTQIHRTAFFPLSPILSQGLLYFYDLILLTRSHLTASCRVRYTSTSHTYNY